MLPGFFDARLPVPGFNDLKRRVEALPDKRPDFIIVLDQQYGNIRLIGGGNALIGRFFNGLYLSSKNSA